MRFRDLVLDVEDPYARVIGKGRVTRDCPLPRKWSAPSRRTRRAARSDSADVRVSEIQCGSTTVATR